MSIEMYGPIVEDFDPEPAVRARHQTKAVHIQGGHNKNNILNNKECVQKMLM